MSAGIYYIYEWYYVYTHVYAHTHTHILSSAACYWTSWTHSRHTHQHTHDHIRTCSCNVYQQKENTIRMNESHQPTHTHTHSVLYTITVQQQYTIFNHSNMWGYAIHWSLLCILVLSMPTVSSLCVLCSTVLWSCVHVLGLSRCLLAGCTCNHRHLVFVKCTGWGGVANWFVLLV